MRIGQNPAKAKGSPAYAPQRIGLATLTYVPALEGYHREALDVIKIHLTSLRASLEVPCDLCVFDNGSCPEVLNFLYEQWQDGLIDWLCLSNHNLGKNGALNWIFGALPNEFIGYSDSDVFFRKGWLEQTMRVFESFERAGMVSAQPVFFDFLKGEARTAREIGQSGGQLEVISVQPRAEILEEYCDGINASPEMRQQFRSQLLQTAINHQTGMRAVTSATDMQFMLRKEVAARMIPMPIAGALTGKDAIEIPRGVEAQGYWILSTEEPLVWHIGNSISDRPYPEIERLMSGKEVSGQRAVDSSQWAVGSRQEAVDSSQCVVSSGQTASGGLKSRFKASMQRGVRRSPVVKRWMERLYAGLFSLLYEEIRFPHP